MEFILEQIGGNRFLWISRQLSRSKVSLKSVNVVNMLIFIFSEVSKE